MLIDIQKSLFDQAKTFQTNNIHIVDDYINFKATIEKGGFVKCGWDGTPETENQIKKETKATIRCIPFSQKIDGLNCIYSNNPAKYEVIFARSY